MLYLRISFDLSTYDNIILASPLCSLNLSTPIKSLLKSARIKKQKRDLKTYNEALLQDKTKFFALARRYKTSNFYT